MTGNSRYILHLILQVTRPAAGRQQNKQQAGSILLTTLVVILVAMIGAATLMSRSINSLNATSDASDLQTAKEAAETGFNEILAALNTDQRSYLLVTKMTNWVNVSTTDLDNCNIYHPSATLPSPPAGYPDSFSFYQTAGFNGSVSYKLESYEPPISIGTASNCVKFGNLFGGSANFTVVGTLTRNGKQQATFRLKKVVFIKGPFSESSQPFDAPLLITGAGPSSNNDVTKMDKNKFGMSSIPDACIVADNRKCNSPSPGLQTTYVACSGNPKCIPPTSNIGPLNASSLNLPPLPTGPSYYDDKRSSGDYDKDKVIVYSSTKCNFPYVGATGCPTTANALSFVRNQLEQGCYYNVATQPGNSDSTRVTQNSTPSTAINCVVMSMNNPNYKINTAGLPINIFVVGSGTVINLQTPADFSNLIPLNWAKLRIYGTAGDGSNCTAQLVNIKGVLQLDGLFIWMPAGKFIYQNPGGGGGNNGPYGVRWVCAFDSKDSANLNIIGPANAVAGLSTIFSGFFSPSAPDTSFNPSFIPSNITNYRAYGVTY
ncbi:MAG: hypothetical protein WAM11_03635 [Cyanobium sp.]